MTSRETADLVTADLVTADLVTADLVTAGVIRSAMETVCFEMATYVSRTATTPILNQSNERNATVLDARGRLAASVLKSGDNIIDVGGT